jgi:hypothetical protein
MSFSPPPLHQSHSYQNSIYNMWMFVSSALFVSKGHFTKTALEHTIRLSPLSLSKHNIIKKEP